jgi:hypothetical protein
MRRTLPLLITALALVIDSALGFVVQHTPTLQRRSSAIFSSFDSESWKAIEADLDALPVFTVATEDGEPLAYIVETNGKSFQVPFFYCDVQDALVELQKAKEVTCVEQIALLPFPLGQAYRMWSNDQAVIVPSKLAMVQAEAPPDTDPYGQQVPFFACLNIMLPSDDGNGKGVLPLFMALEDANTAMTEVLETKGGNPEEFEVLPMSLGEAVDILMANNPGDQRHFQFIAPSTSKKYIDEFLSKNQ